MIIHIWPIYEYLYLPINPSSLCLASSSFMSALTHCVEYTLVDTPPASMLSIGAGLGTVVGSKGVLYTASSDRTARVFFAEAVVFALNCVLLWCSFSLPLPLPCLIHSIGGRPLTWSVKCRDNLSWGAVMILKCILTHPSTNKEECFSFTSHAVQSLLSLISALPLSFISTHHNPTIPGWHLADLLIPPHSFWGVACPWSGTSAKWRQPGQWLAMSTRQEDIKHNHLNHPLITLQICKAMPM